MKSGMHRFNTKELSDSIFRVTRHVNYMSKYGIQFLLPVKHKNVQLAGSSIYLLIIQNLFICKYDQSSAQGRKNYRNTYSNRETSG